MPERILSATNAAEHRAILEANLPHEATVYEDEGTENAAGAHVADWIPVELPVACSLSRLSPPQQLTMQDQRVEVAQFRVRFDAGTEITDRHMLRVAGTSAGLPWVRDLVVLGVEQSDVRTAAVCRAASPAERAAMRAEAPGES